jgi:hypothetical protein
VRSRGQDASRMSPLLPPVAAPPLALTLPSPLSPILTPARRERGGCLRLGEEVAIAVLEELRLTGNEQFQGWSLRRFDGTRVSVG